MITLYIFIDESGDWDFSPSGSKYLIWGSLSMLQPSEIVKALLDLKANLNYAGEDVEYFHASEDRQGIRDQVFQLLSKEHFDADFVIVEKRKANPTLQDMRKLYPKIATILLKYVLWRYLNSAEEIDRIIIFTDRLPKRKKEAIEKALKQGIRSLVGRVRFHIYHHSSPSHFGLQAIDYCVWAVFRKWERDDHRSYNLIANKVRSEFDVFHHGDTFYY